ncbi:ABC transporter permease [Falsihalocynthiibacter sp. S25ZX9]|uniref:ABC transporter permease n=1 Tax=Falsihalocynthiibacter sp. S25ZX9 TaxID=3240870 RepID=UPI00350F96AE
MSLRMAARIARRELRGGLSGFRVFVMCLALGVAAIAAVGSVRSGLEQGLADEGGVILGGDAELKFTYRFADEDERAWMANIATEISEVADFRSMAVTQKTGSQEERALTQLKAVDAQYPLIGDIVLDGAPDLASAFAAIDGVPGAVMDPVLIARLDLQIGDKFTLGTQEFRLAASLLREPDAAGSGFGLGPRTMVLRNDLAQSGLLEPGTLFESKYRLRLAENTDLEGLKTVAIEQFADKGVRWRDMRNGAPGISRFVERIGAFLVLVGLAGLAVGGVGISAAVRTYLEAKTEVIAILKTLGAEGRTIFAAYFIQIGVLTLFGIGLGLILGAVLPFAIAPLLAARFPFPIDISFHAAPMIEAAIYGALTALLFTLWPLAKTENIRAAALFRSISGGESGWPRPRYIVVTGLLLALLVFTAASFSGVPRLTLWAFVGVLGALALLTLMAGGLRIIARKMGIFARGNTAVRMALSSIAAPGGEARSVVLSLGLGLSVLAAVGQIDSNLRAAISQDLPDVAPSYFFVDIQPDQLAGFEERAATDEGVDRVQSAPMLRGVITQINDQPARDVAGDHWVLRGDRGVTYAALPPENTTLTNGDWWPEDYSGPPVMSFGAEEAAEMGLKLGDRLTVNILGRDLTAEITSFRSVDFSEASMNFVMIFNPSALEGAPHSHIATVYAQEEAEAAFVRDVSRAYPNVSAIRVRDAIARVTEALGAIAAATSFGAAATLLTGFIVLIGAAAAGERARVFEAAVLKTLGATRGTILASFALRSALLGAAAGVVATLAGAIAGWAVMVFVMENSFRFNWMSAITIIVGGAAITTIAGLIFAWRPLATRPAPILRARE